MGKELSSREEAEVEAAAKAPLEYSRRDAVKALAKYSAAVGGAAAAVVTADGLVSEASAYKYKEKKLKKVKKPKKPKKPKK
ncbi:hypothetical protein [Cribrihabitans neustonicus]|uniref:hypothetical protein n=1 Tax=Cribrihabitans neustonicus TaxID=1429085 RepID=UPI003B59637E